MEPAYPPWRFRGEALRVIDGDTLRVRLDLGFGIDARVDLRLVGYDAPERHSHDPAERAAGEAAAARLAALVLGRPLLVTTERERRTFARYLAHVALWQGDAWRDLVALLREGGDGVAP